MSSTRDSGERDHRKLALGLRVADAGWWNSATCGCQYSGIGLDQGDQVARTDDVDGAAEHVRA